MALRLRDCLRVIIFVAVTCGCQPNAYQASTNSSTNLSSTSSKTTTPATFSSTDAVQIITQASSTGSFNPTIAPATGGLTVNKARVFNLDGTLMNTPPSWFVKADVFLTSTRTSANAPTFNPGSDTPCAYFSLQTDFNPDSGNGFYTISGNNQSLSQGNNNYINQCNGTASAERTNIGIHITFNRSFMNATDKFLVLVKAKPIDAPFQAPNNTSCFVNNTSSPTTCTNQLYSISMRQQAGTTPILIQYLFPSAKALDLLSESVLVPIHTQPTYTVISIDRIQGGVVFYDVKIIRSP